MATRGAKQIERSRSTAHEGFLQHRRYRWLKIALGLSIVAAIIYLGIDVQPRHNGGSWYGYTLGTIAALLILWLTMLGVRKRAMTRGYFSLKAWTDARVDPKTPKRAVKCDMCSGIAGGPACVRACPTGAAIRVKPEEFLTVARLEV